MKIECKHKYKVLSWRGKSVQVQCTTCGYKPSGNSSKYGNIKTTIHDIKFDSKLESVCYLSIVELLKTKQITKFDRQFVFTLMPGATTIQGNKLRPITYHADFVIHRPTGIREVIDAKGKQTEEFRIKWKLLQYQFKDDPTIKFRLFTEKNNQLTPLP